MMAVIKSGCTHMGVASYIEQIITGSLIVVAVALDRLRHRRVG